MSARSGKRAGPDAAAAMRLLKMLRETDVTLRRCGDRLLLDGGNSGTATRDVAPELVRYCLAHDWLTRQSGALVLSEAGVAWLKRTEAGEDGFLRQHQVRGSREVEIGGVQRRAATNEAESPLGWLRSRKDRDGRPLISDAQYEAGERLRADYYFAQLSQRVTANWQALVPGARGRRGAPSGAAGLRDEVIAARQRVERALAAIGPELSGVLIDICCELKGLEEAEKAQGWPARAGKVVLQIALSRLARHYGLIAEASHERPRRLRHWGTEDYRPTLAIWHEAEAGTPEAADQ